MNQIVKFLTSIVLLAAPPMLYAQKPYFADGYHGGIYGHYPLWVTGFMASKLSSHPEWRVGLEIEPETWDTVRIRDPHGYSRFSELAAGSRVDFTNPTYAQPYCYNISGESIIRQFEYGMRKISGHFPGVQYHTYAVEEPCFTSSLPQLLRQFGFRYAVLKCPNTCWGGYTAAFGGELVNWTGPDGTSILSVPRYASEDLEENSTWQTTAWDNSTDFIQAAYTQGIQNPVGMCYQDAGWKNGPWLGTGDAIKNGSTYVTWTEYMEKISSGKTDLDWRLSQEDIHVNLMWGSQALQRIAQNVRRAENSIIMAEKIAAMAALENGYLPEDKYVREAWRTLMMAQHHDSWIVPYNKLNGEQTWEQAVNSWTDTCTSLSDTIVKGAVASYSKNSVHTDDLGHIRIFNTVATQRSEVVRVELPKKFPRKGISVQNSKGIELPYKIEQDRGQIWLTFRADLAGLGYATYALRKTVSNPAKDERAQVKIAEDGRYVIENDMYRMTLDPTKGGTITSLRAKFAGGKELVEGKGEYGFNEVSGHFYDLGKTFSSMESDARISVLQDDRFAIKIKVEGSVASHPLTQFITLQAGRRRIDLELDINWKGNVGIGEYRQQQSWTDNRRAYTDDRFKLKVLFSSTLSKAELYKNAPFDVCRSSQKNTFFGTWDSIKHNVILNWVDLVQDNGAFGMALFSDHTTSYIYGEGYPLGLTAQYSGSGLWGVDYKISAPLRMRYALVPHQGRWDSAGIAMESARWNEPLISRYGRGFQERDRTIVCSSDTGLEIPAMKVEENGDLLLRLYNAQEGSRTHRLTLGFPVQAIAEELLNGQTIGMVRATQMGENTSLSVDMPSHGIKTLRIKKKNKFN
ncbi:glycoside hydrolase family 38 N-terminal domain-containing protein [Sphingobacterium suaedae]|uniref:Glycoside hydrolase family 38 C-terminal domain-containing protein n=1 Tax=Sphingobacterium suaedae TaxID=1686402 RepID=A0ABW5KL56_9SPHI